MCLRPCLRFGCIRRVVGGGGDASRRQVRGPRDLRTGPVLFCPMWYALHNGSDRALCSTNGRSQQTDRECVPSRPLTRARSPCNTEMRADVVHRGAQISSSSVIGPSFTELTCMRAPKTPGRHRAAPAAQLGDDLVDQRLGDLAGRGVLPGGTAALAGVGVERELADDQHGQARGRRPSTSPSSAGEDAQLVDLAGQRPGRGRRRRPGPRRPVTAARGRSRRRRRRRRLQPLY